MRSTFTVAYCVERIVLTKTGVLLHILLHTLNNLNNIILLTANNRFCLISCV